LLVLGTSQGGLNGGDILFQFIMLILLLAIAAVILSVFMTIRRRNDRSKRVEEKLDKLLTDKENNHT
jgi:preprotein translocase subunit YajC